jgi:hypothetical protein
MRLLAYWSCCLFLWTIVAMAVDAQEKRVDPSGTWRWDLDMNGETIKNVLKLEADKEGKLSGTLEASDRKLNVEKGQVDKDEVTFSITLELNQTIEVQFRGKQKGDSIQGKFTAKTPDDDREFKWEATRSVEIADVLGTWQLSIETPDGQMLKPVLTLEKQNTGLKGSYANAGQQLEAKGLKLKDNHLYFEIDADYQGSPLHVEFKGRPYGAKLQGTLEYSVNGDSGEIDFTGMRKKD